MVVRFTKGPAAGSDTLTCVRPDGTATSAPMPRAGVLPREACHFVIESALQWPDAFFGAVARGASIADALRQLGAVSPAASTRARQAKALVQSLSEEQWSGASDPAGFIGKLAAACHREGVATLEITAGEIGGLRLALREFGAAWRPLAAGAALERAFRP